MTITRSNNRTFVSNGREAVILYVTNNRLSIIRRKDGEVSSIEEAAMWQLKEAINSVVKGVK